MSYADFNKWMNSKKSVDVIIMDGAQIIVKVEKAKIMVGCDLNSNGNPDEFTVFKGTTTINIGDRYINQVIKTGEYWSVFVDGWEHYLIS